MNESNTASNITTNATENRVAEVGNRPQYRIAKQAVL
jgi:hypothetical protein